MPNYIVGLPSDMDGDSPIFLTVDDVLEFHADQVETFGGDPGVRDIRLLESALAQPSQTYDGHYLHKDLLEMAAAYLFHIVQNHPFADGNKRTGIHTAHVFLALNGISMELPTEQTEVMVLGLATGKLTKTQIAEFFRQLLPKENQPGSGE
jgi:death on curing protein